MFSHPGTQSWDTHLVLLSIVPSEDAHGSKYVAASDKRREFITGYVLILSAALRSRFTRPARVPSFTGPSGVAIVSQDHAYLVADSGYWNQAEIQTDRNWQVIRTDNTKNSKTYQDWITFLLVGNPLHKNSCCRLIDSIVLTVRRQCPEDNG